MQPVRLWTLTTPKVYQDLLLYLSTTIDKHGKKMNISTFIVQAVLEKISRDELLLKSIKSDIK